MSNSVAQVDAFRVRHARSPIHPTKISLAPQLRWKAMPLHEVANIARDSLSLLLVVGRVNCTGRCAVLDSEAQRAVDGRTVRYDCVPGTQFESFRIPRIPVEPEISRRCAGMRAVGALPGYWSVSTHLADDETGA